MKELELKYGCNPNQKPAKIYLKNGRDLPIEVLNGRPGYINFLDAFNSIQLVMELKKATGIECATSFKHVSPTSTALGLKMSENLKKACFVDDIEGLDNSPIALAYARARGTDRMSSFGDWIALSDTCDVTTAKIIKREVSDGIIAPDFDEEALEILRTKKNGNYNIVKINLDNYVPSEIETKEVFGVTFSQRRNDCEINGSVLSNVVSSKNKFSPEAKRDLIVALITLKYTQSNSVCFSYDAQAIGVGAGQQSRIHCTMLAAEKADKWLLRQSEKVLNLPFKEGLSRAIRDNAVDVYLSNYPSDLLSGESWKSVFTRKPELFSRSEMEEYLKKISGVSLASDAFFPFSDNVVRAYRSGVSNIAQPGGSLRDSDVIKKCDELGITMAFTGIRLFHH
ncbi:MAG: 5-aminoimidazole-4-carboxamide ribonucleotide transformylase [Clostridiales bacterium]|nr:MAG: 5-aminoimidazole-4-carboxamide ribonucleotide transformylase [Clostridiales bacterium]